MDRVKWSPILSTNVQVNGDEAHELAAENSTRLTSSLIPSDRVSGCIRHTGSASQALHGMTCITSVERLDNSVMRYDAVSSWDLNLIPTVLHKTEKLVDLGAEAVPITGGDCFFDSGGDWLRIRRPLR